VAALELEPDNSKEGRIKGTTVRERESIRDWGKAVLKDRERITVELPQSKYKILELASPEGRK